MSRYGHPAPGSPESVAGIRQRRLERDLPAGAVTVEEIERLRRLSWAALQREALEAGVSLGKVKQAPTRDALRLQILLAKV